MSSRLNAAGRSVRVLAGVLAVAVAFSLPWPGPAVAHGDPGDLGWPRFVEVTAAAGLGDYLHAGYLGDGLGGDDPLFTEISGPGACWLDADADGWLDVFLVNGRYQSDPDKDDRLDPHSQLHRNLGDGTFEDVSEASGAALRGVYQGCAAADYDNDADPDLFVTGWGGNALLRNEGSGVFLEVAEAAGVRQARCGDFNCWSSSASWLDYDRDGCLDLYVDHFGDFDADNPPEQLGPEFVDGQKNALFHNGCDGTFEDRTDAAGLAEAHHSWSNVAADLNDDGWPDVYVSNDGDENDLYHNNGDGTFTRRGDSALADRGGGMGTAVTDFNHDDRFDVITTNFVAQINTIGRAEGDDFDVIGDDEPFTDALPFSGWGVHWPDLNHDGHPDLMIVNGMTTDDGILALKEPVLAYENLDGQNWRIIRDDLGPDIAVDFVARGASWADYDNDGDLDVQLSEAGENPTHLFEARDVGGNFLLLDLVGGAPGVNRDAVGARVHVRAAGLADQHQEKMVGTSYMSSNDARLHFGLATAEAADVTVRWPDGATESWPGLRANAVHRLTQGVAEAATLLESPFLRLHGPRDAERLAPLAFEAEAVASGGAEPGGVRWDFGDGAAASGDAVTHAFDDVGPFIVRATVTDSAGRSKTSAHRVFVHDDLDAEVRMDKPVFLPSEAARGSVVVRFSNGDPVPAASVSLRVAYSTGIAEADAIGRGLPSPAPELLGFEPEWSTSGTTDGAGRFAFVVPYSVERPNQLAPAEANHPGDYAALAEGGARGSVFDPTRGGYRVGVPAPE